MREIILDTETTGLDPSNGDRIVEIGCIELRNRTPTGRNYQQYINPERDVPEAAYRISKLSTEFLKPFPVFASIAQAFLEFIGDAPLVIHNAKFDLGFLNAELTRTKREIIPAERAIDTVTIARHKYPGAPASLDALCRRFSVSLGEREAKGHGALLDCHLLAQVYLELTGGRQPGLAFTAGDSTNANASGPRIVNAAKRQKPLPSRLTAEDVLAHQELISALKGDVIWRWAMPNAQGAESGPLVKRPGSNNTGSQD